MSYRTTLATFNLSLSDKLGACTERPLSEFSVVADAAGRGAARFSQLSAVPVVALFECLDALQFHRTVLMR
jgi:hypothetical protein